MEDEMRKRFWLKREVCDSLGWLFCEIAFRCDMRWGTERLYELGSWFYGLTTPVPSEVRDGRTD